MQTFEVVGKVGGMIQSDERQLIIVDAAEIVAAYIVVICVKIVLAKNHSRVELRDEGEFFRAKIAFQIEADVGKVRRLWVSSYTIAELAKIVEE